MTDCLFIIYSSTAPSRLFVYETKFYRTRFAVSENFSNIEQRYSYENGQKKMCSKNTLC